MASGDTEKTADEKTESTSGSRPKSDAKGGKGDAITTEDENVFTGDGTVTAFIGEPFYDDDHRIYSWPEGSTGQVAIVVPEGKYAMILILENEEDKDLIYYLYSEDGWESYDREGIEEKLGDLDAENVFEAGSGERKELDAPEW